MPEAMNDKKVFTLLEVTKSIQKTITDRYKSTFWVKAEMNKLNLYKQSGHCYPELVEKKDGKIIAQIKSFMWMDDYNRVNHKFQSILKEPLKDGIKILFQAKISFDPAHGLALWIIDIDPAYTLGDLEREKQETIQQLVKEGIFNKNKLLKLALLPQRIAIISVETSKGYVDFTKVLESNDWNYKFFHMLFPALLQGDKAVQSIIGQLQQIKKIKKHFDVVAIIRGGGGDVGLSCYNHYQLTKEIADFPLPVLTGIGHATNETVAEMISFNNAITPTKLAEYLIQRFHQFSVPVLDAERKITDKSKRILSEEKTRFYSEIKLFRSVTENILIKNKNDLKEISNSMGSHAKFNFKNHNRLLDNAKLNISKSLPLLVKREKLKLKNHSLFIFKDVQTQLNKQKLVIQQLNEQLKLYYLHKLKISYNELNNIEKNIQNMSPEQVLKRGYSITLFNGKALRNIEDIKNGDVIKTILDQGHISSTIISTNQKENNE